MFLKIGQSEIPEYSDFKDTKGVLESIPALLMNGIIETTAMQTFSRLA